LLANNTTLLCASLGLHTFITYTPRLDINQSFQEQAATISNAFHHSNTGVPTWGTCTPGVRLPIRRGTFKVSNRR